MTKMRKVKRSIATAVFVWVGRRMLGRVHKQMLKSVTGKPRAAKPTTSRIGRIRAAARLRRPTASGAAHQQPSRARRRTAQGFAFALLSAAAVAALKVGVDHVIESEREQHLVTPDFDVFADDDE